MADEPIISSDTRRENRLPPRQALTQKWPVLHAGSVPPFDPAKWTLTLFPAPLTGAVKQFTWAQFGTLLRCHVFADIHCVTRWSKLDNLWEGVATRELRNHITVSPRAKFVMVHCEYGFTTNLPIEDFFAEDCLLATHHNGQPLTPEHGYPLRLVVPRLYAWKSAKWVRGIEFLEEDRPGYWESWENGGYHMRGDPWQGGDSGDGQRFRPGTETGGRGDL
ncbi:sulfite oxidase-like oxidoreductase [Gemmata sp. G18]|uniref:Sulfite oxidase-like oxidoreductase n=1 Tax=Gemmata palustris TaxID=2822762 RepID=A0ABS5BPD5_9BACT|nr:sulfite oxidase-like oxidoreductase [Gemmata palustris]MBP3955581.1 sulfite oxidase-like oxidoreductase [Gemmata palustris]